MTGFRDVNEIVTGDDVDVFLDETFAIEDGKTDSPHRGDSVNVSKPVLLGSGLKRSRPVWLTLIYISVGMCIGVMAYINLTIQV